MKIEKKNEALTLFFLHFTLFIYLYSISSREHSDMEKSIWGAGDRKIFGEGGTKNIQNGEKISRGMSLRKQNVTRGVREKNKNVGGGRQNFHSAPLGILNGIALT